MSQPYSFYGTYNPYLTTKITNSTFDFYKLLKENKNPNFYLYWPKVKGSKSNPALDILLFKKALSENVMHGHESHFYITDFKSFWIGRVEDVVNAISDEEKEKHTIDAFKDPSLEIEAWFKISDFDLMTDEFKETNTYINFFSTNHELKGTQPALENLTPYISNLRYPLIVQFSLFEPYFSSCEDTETPLKKCWSINQKIEMSDTYLAVSKAIKNYCIPSSIFDQLPQTVKDYLVAAETHVFEAGINPNNISDINTKHYRALEFMFSMAFSQHLRNFNLSKEIRLQQTDRPKFIYEDEYGKYPLFKMASANQKIFTVSDILYLFRNDNRSLSKGLTPREIFQKKPEFYNFLKTYSEQLHEIVNSRNAITHEYDLKGVERSQLIRNTVLGIGRKGLISELSRFISNSNAKATPQKLKIAS